MKVPMVVTSLVLAVAAAPVIAALAVAEDA